MARPELQRIGSTSTIGLTHADRGRYRLHFEGSPELLFTENETNCVRIFGLDNSVPFVKDSINDYVVHSAKDAAEPGTARDKGRRSLHDTRGRRPVDCRATAIDRWRRLGRSERPRS